jgi:DNA-binding response OmpR family regulator/predicted Ser/Thr protein kinase
VVEDNPDMRALVKDICSEEYEVIEAENGLIGLEVIQQNNPALVLLDVMMPQMDGHEMLRRVRADPAMASVPVILLTAKAGSEAMLEGLESGANDYLGKPFEARELLARIRNLVCIKQQEQDLRELNANLQQEVVKQAGALERARMLGRYLSPTLTRSILEEGQPVQVEQQRRRLTVFLLELHGFEERMEDLEAEDVTAMVNGYLSAMMDLAFCHGATVDKLHQDKVGGFFGAPTSESPEQDALRCCRMAVEMWQRAAKICIQWREHLRGAPPVPTMALASGFATVGNFGSTHRLEYTAIGGPAVKKEIEGEFLESVKAQSWSNPMDLYRSATPAALGDETVNLPAEETPTDSKVRLLEKASPSPQDMTQRKDIGPASKPDELSAGTVISSRYEVVKKLGMGGMGVVYQVRDMKLNTDVALKLMRQHLGLNPNHLRRLYSEVKLARLITHANVARIYDLGEWEGNEFITMEHIAGHSLSYRLKRGEPFEPIPGTRVFKEICAGLSAAHLAGIIHRDLKPSNIMLEETTHRVAILDFGIAQWTRSVQETDPGTSGTSGTPSYMAPEQFRGMAVDLRTDIYSLGLVAYEMFTGKRPFRSDHPEGMGYQHVHEPPPHPQEHKPDLPPRLAAVILRCLEKDPAARFQTVTEIGALL